MLYLTAFGAAAAKIWNITEIIMSNCTTPPLPCQTATNLRLSPQYAQRSDGLCTGKSTELTEWSDNTAHGE